MSASILLYGFAVVGGLIQGALTLRWYQPPPRNGEIPTPIFEAVLYTVIFSLMFAGYGWLLLWLRDLFPPYTGFLLLFISLIGGALLYAQLSGRLGSDHGMIERALAVVTNGVIALFPLIALLV